MADVAHCRPAFPDEMLHARHARYCMLKNSCTFSNHLSGWSLSNPGSRECIQEPLDDAAKICHLAAGIGIASPLSGELLLYDILV